MSENEKVTIETLNALKRESDKWTKVGVTVLVLVFVVPLLYVLTVFMVSNASRSANAASSFFRVAGFSGLVVFVILALFIFAVVAVFMMATKRSRYRTAYKALFSHRVLSGLLEEYHYAHHEGIPKAALKEIGMVRLGNIYRSEDCVSGCHRDVGFIQADLTIQDEYTDSDGDTHTVTYFNGRWLVFEFPRRFVTKLAVVGGGCRQAVHARGMEKFATESIEFNSRFDVYMQDGVEMFYLLDPKMIEIMQALSDKYGGKILFLFADKKLHIGINDNTDSFEPPRGQKGDLDEEEEVRRLADEFRTVFELADKLELHKNIFK